MAHATANIISSGFPQRANGWDNPAVWTGGEIPQSSYGLHIDVVASGSGPGGAPAISTDFLPSLIANDVIGVDVGLGLPKLGVNGAFLSVHDLEHFVSVGVGNNGTQIANLLVRHDVVDVGTVGAAAGGTIEIGHDFGGSNFNLDAAGGGPTLILDKPPSGSLGNNVSGFVYPSAPGNSARIELAGISFDHADLIPNTSIVQLTNGGTPVYQLTHVSMTNFGVGPASVSVGVDPTTGYDFVSFHT